MLVAGLFLTCVAQSATPVVEPGSIYGMRTYTENPEFGFLPDKYVVAFPPTDIEQFKMHVLKGSTEVMSDGFYATATPYPTFKVLRCKTPTVSLVEPGDYVIEFRSGGQPVSRFPFTIKKNQSGDEFNTSTSWDFITPMDKMGSLSFSNTEEDPQVWFNFWNAPGREGIALRSNSTIRLSHGGKEIAHTLPYMFQETPNKRTGLKLMRMPATGRAAFTKSDLLKLNGPVTGTVVVNGKTVRTFTWNVNGGKVATHPRSASDHTPRTDYWLPRRLAAAAEGRQFYHLEEQYWAQSK